MKSKKDEKHLNNFMDILIYDYLYENHATSHMEIKKILIIKCK